MNRIKERFTQIVDDLRTAEKADWHTKARMIAATVATVAVLLPWLPVGESGAMSGSRLISYATTSPEIGEWIRTNPLGTILFMTMAPLLTIMAFTTLWQVLHDRTPTANHVITIALPFITLIVAQNPIFDEKPATLGPLPLPEYGLAILIAINLALLIHGIYLRSEKKQTT